MGFSKILETEAAMKPHRLSANSLQPLFLLCLGFLLGLIAYAPQADHLYFFAQTVLKKLSYPRLLFPFYVEILHTYNHRPLAALWVKLAEAGKVLFPLFPSLLHATIPALFGVSVFFCFSLWLSRRMSFLIALLSLLSYPALFSSWHLLEFDTLGAALIYLTLFYLERVRQKKAHWLLFTALFFAAGLVKEASPLLLILILGSYLLTLRRQKTPFALAEKRLFLCALPLLALYLIPGLLLPLYARKQAFQIIASLQGILSHISNPVHPPLFLLLRGLVFLPFAFLSNGFQISLTLFPAGMTIVGLASISILIKKPLRTPYLVAALLLLLLTLLFLPPFSVFDYYGALFLSPPVIPYLLTLFFLFGCFASLRSDSFTLFPSLAILTGWLLVTFASLLIPYSREDVSARVFIPLAPLGFALLLLSFQKLFLLAQGFNTLLRISFLLLITYAAVIVTYDTVAHSWNQSFHYRGLLKALWVSKRALAQNLQPGDFTFFTNRSYFTGGVDIRALNPAQSKTPYYPFTFLNAIRKGKAQERLEALREEVCYKALFVPPKIPPEYASKRTPAHGYPTQPASKRIWIHIVGTQLAQHLPQASKLIHSYRWTKFGFDFLDNHPYNLFVGWDYTEPEIVMRFRYTPKSDVDRLCDRYGTWLSRYAYAYHELPFYLESLPRALFQKIPLSIPFNFRGDLCQIKVKSLNCNYFDFTRSLSSLHPKPWRFYEMTQH